MNVLVTGATGFVGSVLLPRLIERYGAEAVSAFVLPGDRIPESWAGRDGQCYPAVGANLTYSDTFRLMHGNRTARKETP